MSEFDFTKLREYLESVTGLPNASELKALKRGMVKKLGAVYLQTAKENTPVGEKKVRKLSSKEFIKVQAGVTVGVHGNVVNEKIGVSGKRLSGLKRIKRRKNSKENQYYLSSTSEHMRRMWGTKITKENVTQTTLEVYNNASYSVYVDKGHRQQVGRYVPILGRRLKKGWVEGLHITDKAELSLKSQSKGILEGEVTKYIERKLHGK